MKLIICGGRDYQLTDRDRSWLDMLRATEGISQVIEGGALGADRGGRDWAAEAGHPGDNG